MYTHTELLEIITGSTPKEACNRYHHNKVKALNLTGTPQWRIYQALKDADRWYMEVDNDGGLYIEFNGSIMDKLKHMKGVYRAREHANGSFLSVKMGVDDAMSYLDDIKTLFHHDHPMLLYVPNQDKRILQSI